MSLRINHNIAAINGHRNMLQNDMAISKNLERLSSGLRINKASDDAAGLVISEQMRAQITGLNQAVDNNETAVSMIQTAEGALDEINSLLNKTRELALHAANEATNDTTQLLADQQELDNAIRSISRISEQTQFGTKKLLDGSLAAANTFDTSKIFQFDVGTNLLARTDYTGGATSVVIDTSAESNTVVTNDGIVQFDQFYFDSSGNVAANTFASGGSTNTTTSTGNFFDGTVSLASGAAVTVTIGGTAYSYDGSQVSTAAALVASLNNDQNLYSFTISGESLIGTRKDGNTATTGDIAFAFVNSGGGTTTTYGTSAASVVADQLSGAPTMSNDVFSAAGTVSAFFAGSLAMHASANLTIRVDDTVFSFGASATGSGAVVSIGNVVSTLNAGQSAYSFTTSAGTIVANRTDQTGALGAAADLSYVFYDISGNSEAILGGGSNSAVGGFNHQTNLTFTGTENGSTVEIGGATSLAAITTGTGSNVADTFAAALGVGTNRLSEGSSITISVAGKDYVFSSRETIDDIVSFVNNAQDDYTLSTDRDTGLRAIRNNLGSAGELTDLSIRITDQSGDTFSTNADSIDRGQDITGHLSGSGLPGGRINLVSDSENGSVLTNDVNGIRVEMNKATVRASESVNANLTKGARFQVGPNADQLVAIDMKAVSATTLGLGANTALANLQELVNQQALVNGLTTEAIDVIDAAIDDVTTLRGQLGAFQANTLESNLNSLRVANENLVAAESTIRDVDFAAESAEFTKNNILIQASTAMMAQANQLPQNVLQLLG